MIRLLKIAVVLGLLWSGLWYAAGYGLRSGLGGWFAAQRARGWQAEYASISTAGFPLRHVTTLTSPALADPVNGTAWRADWLRLDSPAVWPGRQTLHFAPTPQRLSYFDRTAVIEARQMAAQMRLHLGLALAVERMTLTAGGWQVRNDAGAQIGADSLVLKMAQTDQPESYRIDLAAEGFTPGGGLRQIVLAADRLPASFETMTVEMTVRFDRVWDRHALEQRRPQPEQIELHRTELRWGALRLQAAGRLNVDAQGVPAGEIDVTAENWREILAMVRSAGVIPKRALDPAERVLSLLSAPGPDGDTLDVRVTFRDGLAWLGPLPLGPAPRLMLR